MPRQNALSINELWDETQRLNDEVAALQQRLARYESVEAPAQFNENAESHDENRDAEVWNVWPYCWATNAYGFCLKGFHSFHARLQNEHLKRRNRKLRTAFWRKPHPEDITLELV